MRALALLALSLAIVPAALPALQPPDGARVGVVLSGGGAKGFAHVGVLEVLEELDVPIHLVTGNSMGAFVGALYALGYTTDSIAALVTTFDWDALLEDDVVRSRLTLDDKAVEGRSFFALPIRGGIPRLPANLLTGQRLAQALARLTWPAWRVRDFAGLPVPFAAVATDLETGDAVRLDGGHLTDAIRASMTIPGVFSPVEIDGRLLVDGLLVRNLPATDARDLGADLVICSDVSAPLLSRDSLQTIVNILNQAVSFRGRALTDAQRAQCDVLVEPDMAGMNSGSVERAEELIRRGRDAARGLAREIGEVTRRAAPAPPPRPRVRRDSAFVASLAVEGGDARGRRLVEDLLRGAIPGWLGPARLEDLLERARARGRFELVTYRLDPGDDGAVLVVRIDDRVSNELEFGARYETRYKASLLLFLSLDDLLLPGVDAHIDMRLGQQLRLAGQLGVRAGPARLFAFRTEAGFTQVPFDAFDGDRRLSTTDVKLWHGSGFAGLSAGTFAEAGVELRAEHAVRRAAAPGQGPDPRDLTYYTLSATALVDTRDFAFLPTSGLFFSGRTERTLRSISGGLGFQHHSARGAIHIPVTGNTSVSVESAAGASSGPDLPAHYLYYLGGAHAYYMLPQRHLPFAGLEPQELAGRYAQVVGLGAQQRVVDDVFGFARWNAGNVFDSWRVEPSEYLHGFGVGVGARAVAGNGALTVTWIEGFDRLSVSVDLGFPF